MNDWSLNDPPPFGDPMSRREVAYGIVQSDLASDGLGEFIVLPRDVATSLDRLVTGLSCTTWGELRRNFPEVYEQACESNQYVTFEAYLDDREGQASPEQRKKARQEYDALEPSADDPPADDQPFSRTDIGAFNDGVWPTHWREAQKRFLPKGLPERCGGEYGFDGYFVEFPSTAQDAVLEELMGLGYICVEDHELLRSIVLQTLGM